MDRVYNWNEIADYALGTCKSPSEIAEYFEISEEDVEEGLLNYGIELCPYCEWWHEAGELIDENDDVVGCDQCRDNDQVEFQEGSE